MLVQDLRGALLSYWVAKAEGLAVRMSGDHAWVGINLAPYAPHHNHDTAMRLLDHHRLTLVAYEYEGAKRWSATFEQFEGWIDDTLPFVPYTQTADGYKSCGLLYGDAPQEAICKAVVARKYGREVPNEAA